VRTTFRLLAPIAIVPLFAGAARSEPVSLVICAPGYPANTAEAQPVIDALTAAIARAAGWKPGELTGAYYETEAGGRARLAKPDAAVAMLPLALFLEQQEALKLQPRVGAAMKGRTGPELWSLVAKRGALTGPASLSGWQLGSLVGFSPRFIRGPALGGWGRLPDDVKYVQSGQVLSLLRKAAAGERTALLLDGDQAASIGMLPFAADVETVYRSPPMPGGVVATVAGRLPDARWKTLEQALLRLADTPEGARALEGVWKLRFVPLDEKGLAAAQKAFRDAK